MKRVYTAKLQMLLESSSLQMETAKGNSLCQEILKKYSTFTSVTGTMLSRRGIDGQISFQYVNLYWHTDQWIKMAVLPDIGAALSTVSTSGQSRNQVKVGERLSMIRCFRGHRNNHLECDGIGTLTDQKKGMFERQWKGNKDLEKLLACTKTGNND